MIKKIYVIYDLVSKSAYSPLMVADSDEIMQREIKTAKLGEIIESNLEDFDLYCIGTFDTDSACIVNSDKEFICHLQGLKYGTRKECN